MKPVLLDPKQKYVSNTLTCDVSVPDETEIPERRRSDHRGPAAVPDEDAGQRGGGYDKGAWPM